MTALQYIYGICKTLLKENKPTEELCEIIVRKHNLQPDIVITDRNKILKLVAIVRKEVLYYSQNKIELLKEINTIKKPNVL